METEKKNIPQLIVSVARLTFAEWRSTFSVYKCSLFTTFFSGAQIVNLIFILEIQIFNAPVITVDSDEDKNSETENTVKLQEIEHKMKNVEEEGKVLHDLHFL